MPANPFDEFDVTIAKSQADRPRVRARVDGDVVPDILLENVVLRWVMKHLMKPSLEKEVRGKARVSGMARDHPEKEKDVHITHVVGMANARSAM